MNEKAWLGLALLAAAAACTGNGTVIDGTAEVFPECPHSWERITVYDVERNVPIAVSPPLLGPGITRDIPEYHDCQKFVVRDQASGLLRYDSLFAIFRTRVQPTAEIGVAYPLAEILGWNAYSDLGILRGTSCLYLWRSTTPGGPPTWNARMVHMADWDASTDLTCLEPIDVDGLRSGVDLTVAETVTGLPPGAFPDVARWGWQTEALKHTAQLQCGTAWCEVLPSGVTPPPSYLELLTQRGRPPVPGTPAGILHRYMVSGWYDEQLLAYDPEPMDPSNELVPTGIVGRVFPHVELGNKGPGDFRPTADERWTLVGYVALEVPDGEPEAHAAKYLNTYGMEPTQPDAHFEEMNRVFLCQGSKGECGVPSEVEPCPEDDLEEPIEWWGRVLSVSGSERIRCVTRRGHEDVMTDLGTPLPATSRWRWAVNDEGMWDLCVQGCCEMIGDDFF